MKAPQSLVSVTCLHANLYVPVRLLPCSLSLFSRRCPIHCQLFAHPAVIVHSHSPHPWACPGLRHSYQLLGFCPFPALTGSPHRLLYHWLYRSVSPGHLFVLCFTLCSLHSFILCFTPVLTSFIQCLQVIHSSSASLLCSLHSFILCFTPVLTPFIHPLLHSCAHSIHSSSASLLCSLHSFILCFTLCSLHSFILCFTPVLTPFIHPLLYSFHSVSAGHSFILCFTLVLTPFTQFLQVIHCCSVSHLGSVSHWSIHKPAGCSSTHSFVHVHYCALFPPLLCTVSTPHGHCC